MLIRTWVRRMASQAAAPKAEPGVKTRMKAWQLESFAGAGSAQSKSVPVPTIGRPNDVLVKVAASSVNPVDLLMAKGFGDATFRAYRTLTQGQKSCFPLTLGRDFSGVVADPGAGGAFRIGDEVWGAIFPASQGCHADYAVVSQSQLSLKPRNLDHVESASIPYAGLTAWAALEFAGGIGPGSSGRGSKVLVVGASGGVGTLAVQLLKAWDCGVVATCSGDAFEMVSGLGADVVLDYKSAEFSRQMEELKGQFDAILDCSGNNVERHKEYLKRWAGSRYVTLTSPLLPMMDDSGLALGLFRAVGELAAGNLGLAASGGRCYRWAYFMPDAKALKSLGKYAEEGKIRPVVQKVYKGGNMLAAYDDLAKGSARGKIVVDFGSSS